MGSDFSNPPFMENNDSIRVPDRGKPVSDDNGCPSLKQPRQSFLDEPFCFRIDMGGRLVEDKDPWIDR